MLRSSGCGEWPYPSCQLIPYRRRESATTKMTTSVVATRMLVRSNVPAGSCSRSVPRRPAAETAYSP